jgi:acetylornithine deacetylase
MSFDPLKLLSDLVAIPSVNPMGSGATGPEFLETGVTQFLQSFFESLGLPSVRQPVHPHRDNFFARLEGNPLLENGGKLLLLDAHQDTVPVTGMTIPPFEPCVREGRIYGRGSCDIKGGMAAMLAAMAELKQTPGKEMPTIVFVGTINEEHGFTGAQAATKLWHTPNSILPRRPDAAIVAEPTELKVVVAHKGCVRWLCRTRGRAAHSSQPQHGDNAIFRMAKVLQLLEAFQRDIAPTLTVHPLCGPTTLSVGTIHGGLSVNTVPDECVISLDRRLVPGEDPAVARQQLIDYLTKSLGSDFPIVHDAPFLSGTGLESGENQKLGEGLAQTARELGYASECHGVPYGTNAATYAAAGIPTVVFGPGSIAQAHTADEWLAVDQLHSAIRVLIEFCANRTGDVI